MTEEVEEVVVDTAEAFRVAAESARKTLETVSKGGEASDPEPGSSPAGGAEDVSETPKSEVAEAGGQDPEPGKADEVTVDPEAAWNEYKDDEARKKALASTKAYAAQMAQKARELEAKLAEAPKVGEPEVKEVKASETKEEPVEIPYEEWVNKALNSAETDAQKNVAALANEFNKLVVEKYVPAQNLVTEREKATREAAATLKEREVTLKFLQGRKDPSLYEDDIRDAKEAYSEARANFNEAKNAELEQKLEFKSVDADRLALLGVLRKEALTAHQAEIETRKNSISAKRIQEEERVKQTEAEKELAAKQAEVDDAWEKAKLQVIQSKGISDEEAQQVLRDAADGAIIRAANAGKSIPIEDFVKFIEQSSLKPFQATTEKARDKAVRSAISIASEPTPSKATSDKPNVDAQPTNYEEWRRKTRAMMMGKSA